MVTKSSEVAYAPLRVASSRIGSMVSPISPSRGPFNGTGRRKYLQLGLAGLAFIALIVIIQRISLGQNSSTNRFQFPTESSNRQSTNFGNQNKPTPFEVYPSASHPNVKPYPFMYYDLLPLLKGVAKVPQNVTVEAMVFYGRKPTVSILNSYLESNLRRNGGIISKVRMIVTTKDVNDLEYLRRISARNPEYYQVDCVNKGKDGWATQWEGLARENLYFKIDDDVTYIRPGTFELLAAGLVKKKHLIVSANVVNHPLLTHVAGRFGALHPYVLGDALTDPDLAKTDWKVNHLKPRIFVQKTSTDESENNQDVVRVRHQWQPLVGASGMGGTAARITPYDAWSQCTWHSWRCGMISHMSLLKNVEDNQLSRYGTGLWDFHANEYSRFSINFLGFFGATIVDNGQVPGDDEVYLSADLPAKLDRHNVAILPAVVAHFAYFPQREGLHFTNILEKYSSLASETTGRPVLV